MTGRIGFSAIEGALAQQIGSRPGIPTDLSRLLIWRRVLFIEVSSLPVDGALRPIPGGFTILVNGDRTISTTPRALADYPFTNRQRFTIAHEIAHTFYFDLSEIPRPIVVPQRSAEIENICNRIAACILIPRQSIAGCLARLAIRETTCLEIVKLAGAYAVSPEVLLRRLDEIQTYKGTGTALIQCSRENPLKTSKILAAISDTVFREKIGRPKLHSPLNSLFCNQLFAEGEMQRRIFTIQVRGTILRCRSTHSAKAGPYFFLQTAIEPDTGQTRLLP